MLTVQLTMEYICPPYLDQIYLLLHVCCILFHSSFVSLEHEPHACLYEVRLINRHRFTTNSILVATLSPQGTCQNMMSTVMTSYCTIESLTPQAYAYVILVIRKFSLATYDIWQIC